MLVGKVLDSDVDRCATEPSADEGGGGPGRAPDEFKFFFVN